MRSLALLSVLLLPLLFLSAPASAYAPTDRRPSTPEVPRIGARMAKEGFLSANPQVETARPGVVRMPNALGGRDAACIGDPPAGSFLSQASIARLLSAGVPARLDARGQAVLGGEERSRFVDSVARTRPFFARMPSERRTHGRSSAVWSSDISQAVLVPNVLVAQTQHNVSTKADARGCVMSYVASKAAYSQWRPEREGRVSLGMEFVRLAQLFSLAFAPAAAGGSVGVGSPVGLGASEAQDKEQECMRVAQEEGAAARLARLEVAAREKKGEASVAWRALSEDLEACMQLPQAQRGRCVSATEQWLSQARTMVVSIPAGAEPIETACGVKQPTFSADARTVGADEVGAAEAMLARLNAPVGGAAGIEWVRIPGGTFEMGSSGAVKMPAHTVQVSSFALMKTEVTFGQYNTCVSAGGCTPAHTSDGSCFVFNGAQWEKGKLPSSFQGADQPVVCVDWGQAQDFAKWAGGRLPTEAEWEYAARSGGAAWAYPWGDAEATCGRAVMDDGGDGCGAKRTWPVCSKPAGNSTQGVCDMAGNVWEWVQDGYHDSYSGDAGDGTAWEGGGYYPLRCGGGWHDTASRLRASERSVDGPSYRDDLLGFRLAR